MRVKSAILFIRRADVEKKAQPSHNKQPLTSPDAGSLRPEPKSLPEQVHPDPVRRCHPCKTQCILLWAYPGVRGVRWWGLEERTCYQYLDC